VQLIKNEMMLKVGMGSNTELIGTEETSYQNALTKLRGMLLEYYKEMETRGYINAKEKHFFKSGVMFQTLKLALYGFRPDEITEREVMIKTGNYDKLRPSSA
jgi:hypothetical protein